MVVLLWEEPIGSISVHRWPKLEEDHPRTPREVCHQFRASIREDCHQARASAHGDCQQARASTQRDWHQDRAEHQRELRGDRAEAEKSGYGGRCGDRADGARVSHHGLQEVHQQLPGRAHGDLREEDQLKSIPITLPVLEPPEGNRSSIDAGDWFAQLKLYVADVAPSEGLWWERELS